MKSTPAVVMCHPTMAERAGQIMPVVLHALGCGCLRCQLILDAMMAAAVQTAREMNADTAGDTATDLEVN